MNPSTNGLMPQDPWYVDLLSYYLKHYHHLLGEVYLASPIRGEVGVQTLSLPSFPLVQGLSTKEKKYILSISNKVQFDYSS